LFSLSRYSSLSEAHRQAFGSEEDTLLSLVLHNLLVYMLMVGLSTEETTDLIHRLMARTRLATAEERLLQQTLKHVEQNVREGGQARHQIHQVTLLLSQKLRTLPNNFHTEQEVPFPLSRRLNKTRAFRNPQRYSLLFQKDRT